MRVKTLWVALVCGTALVMPVAAQDEPAPKEPAPAETKPATSDAKPAKSGIEDPPLHRWGGWTISLAGWQPSLVGANEDIATYDVGGIATPVVQGSEARTKETVRVSYHLPKDRGSIVGQYDAMNVDDKLQNFVPGQFIFREVRGYPGALGVFDDGLADGVSSEAQRRTREFRLEYQRSAFTSRWANGTWGVGYRELSHGRGLGITSYAIVPNLPPVIPPVLPDNFDPNSLTPLPDTVSQASDFTGHGLGVSLDVEFPLHPRVSIVSGISLGFIRGKAEGTYTSTSSYYNLTKGPTAGVPLTKAELFDILANPQPPADPTDPNAVYVPQIADIIQTSSTVSQRTSHSLLAQSYDVYLGVQVICYKGLRAFATLRDVSYTNIGEYVVPKPGPSTETTALNAGYEGYTVGLSYRF
jgi:hypothetical protein